MKIVLATGIYPPTIGGPATYAYELAKVLQERGVEVCVVTYGEMRKCGNVKMRKWNVVCVSKRGGPVCRWRRYAKALRQCASDADAVIAFSSVSCGVPLWMAKLKQPKKILRLGGDFFWERYTDHGGRRTLREFYEQAPLVYSFVRLFVARLLRQFDHIVFSTKFQEEMYGRHYKHLPPHSVIENALETKNYQRVIHSRHEPFRLLWMGRFVGFKNLPVLFEAVSKLEGVTLTVVGEGPLRAKLQAHSSQLKAPIAFLPSVHGEEKQKIFAEHDLLVLPSLTEISPNVALEARAAGLPVLLTEVTGLSGELQQGMVVRDLSTLGRIVEAVTGVREHYEEVAAADHASMRTWGEVAEEWRKLVNEVEPR